VRQFVGFLLFLVFCEDLGAAYRNHFGTPMSWVFDLLLEPSAIKLRPLDVILIVILIASSKRDKYGGMTPPMKNALYLVLGVTVVGFTYGILRGGEARYASWQTYLIASTVLMAFTVAATHRTPADYFGLGKWILGAAAYRASFCWLSYFTWGRKEVGLSGAYLTTHDDTIPWVVSILILIVNTIDRRSTLIALRNVVLMFFFVGAIQFNSRRLAWVSLGMGVAALYMLRPPGGAAKRTINRFLRYGIPALLLYVIVGWGRANPIFLPLRALSSVTTEEDTSTLARNAENLGLVATARSASYLFGTGWGRPYIYLTMKYDISGFELWKYVPHNSILALLAFSGLVGFSGFWLALPTAVFLNARIARLARDPKARTAAIIGASQIVVCLNQLYGDMGIFFPKVMYTVAISYAMALRLPGVAGVWGSPAAKPAPER
jgi:hypothetical protein